MWTRRRADLPRTCYRVATTRQPEIDALIETHAQNWRLERMAVVDRNLLRAAVAEMLAYPNTPAAIIINESLEIARRYAAPESVQFLNGVLDAIARSVLKQRLAWAVRVIYAVGSDVFSRRNGLVGFGQQARRSCGRAPWPHTWLCRRGASCSPSRLVRDRTGRRRR